MLLIHIAKNFFISIPLHYTQHIYSDVFVDVFRLYDPGGDDDDDNNDDGDGDDDDDDDENTMFKMIILMMILMMKMKIMIILINRLICMLDVKKSSVSISSKLLSMMKAFQSGMDEEEMRYRSSDMAMLIGLYHEEV